MCEWSLSQLYTSNQGIEFNVALSILCSLRKIRRLYTVPQPLYRVAYSYSVSTRSSFQDGSPPLHSAVSGNQQEIVELLIEKYNADPAAAATMVSLISQV